MTPPVTVVVLSWNGREDTLACLESLAAATYPALSVVVVDNGSSDGSAEAVATEHPDVTLIRLDANLGFAGGMNVGIAEALSHGAELVMLLNNDTVVEPGFVEPLVDALDPGGDAAAVCSQIVFRDDPATVWYAGASFRPGRGHHGSNLGYGEPRLAAATPPFATDRACGGAMLVPAGAWSEIGDFDESLFAYAEDTDWSLRAARAGRRILVAPASVVQHAVSAASGGASSPDPLYYSLRNGLVVSERWAPLGRVRTWLRRGEAVAAHLAQALRSGRRREGVRAVRDGWRDVRAGRLGRRGAA